MVKLVVKQPGFFVNIPGVGSFRSPFKVRIPESLVSVVKTTLLKEGIKGYELERKTNGTSVSKKKEEKVKTEVKTEEPVDLSPLMKRLDKIESLVQKVLQREPEKVVIQKVKGEPPIREIKEEDIEVDMFIPTISKDGAIIDLTAKTSEKDDIESRVQALSNLKEKGR